MPDAQRTPRSQAALDQALDDELLDFERLMASVWIVMLATGLVACAVVAAAVTFELGIACGGLCAAYLVAYVPIRLALRRGPPGPVLRVVIDVIEATIPWSFALALLITEGGAYALGSWVPPMLFALLLLSHVVRMRTRTPWIMGVVGALTYTALYLFVIRDHVEEAFAGHVLFGTRMQLVRAFSLLFAGVVSSVAVCFLRKTILRADRVVRERELFGKYRLGERIAVGGMAEVFEAVYAPEGGFERRVAIKRIHAHLAEQPRFVELFRSEAELGSRLAHPNIVQVLDFGSRDDTYFLAMEFVDGVNLAKLLAWAARTGRELPEPVVGAVLRGILEGLHHAHEVARGPDGAQLRVLHRDLCPQNVLVSRNGEVKISDFGVARALRDAESSHTQTVVGHFGYMAPEQALAEPFDHRVDVFSVGVIAWELLTRRRLFKRETQAATVEALLNLAVLPPSTVRPGIDPGWDALVGAALHRDRAARPRSARHVLAALDRIRAARADEAPRALAAIVRAYHESDASPPEEAPTLVDAGLARAAGGPA